MRMDEFRENIKEIRFKVNLFDYNETSLFFLELGVALKSIRNET